MRKLITALTVALLIISYACNEISGESKAAPVTSPNSATANLNDLSSKFSTSWNTRDSAGLMTLMANDVVMNSGSLKLKGKDSIGARWIGRNLQVTKNLKINMQDKETDDNLSYEAGTWTLDVVPHQKPASKSSGTYTFVWKKQTDNNWKIRLINIENEN
ncbi:MAG: hypothetical protein JWQ96_1812 [Segetibacter sp.]|nr:hypothetical protein [Segetibacter sp.]